MFRKAINQSLCDRCLRCVEICSNSRVISTDADRWPFFDAAREHQCIYCGHCMAICPQDAISFTRPEEGARDVYLADSLPIPSQSDPIGMLTAVRSEPNFIERTVDRGKLERVLDSMVRAPSSRNEQNRNIYILDTRQKVSKFDAAILSHYRRLFSRFDNPIVLSIAAGVRRGSIMETRRYETKRLQVPR